MKHPQGPTCSLVLLRLQHAGVGFEDYGTLHLGTRYVQFPNIPLLGKRTIKMDFVALPYIIFIHEFLVFPKKWEMESVEEVRGGEGRQGDIQRCSSGF